GHGTRRWCSRKTGIVATDKHPQVGPGWDKFVHRVIQLKQPLLIQHHESHAGDGLAHRIDAKDAVVLHGPGAFELQISLRFKIGDLPLAGHERERASDFASIDVAPHMGANALQTRRRESDFFRFYEHKSLLWEPHGPIWGANARSLWPYPSTIALRARIGKSNGIFALVSTGAHPRSSKSHGGCGASYLACFFARLLLAAGCSWLLYIRTYISCFMGLASCGAMGSLLWNSLWLITVDPHRSG